MDPLIIVSISTSMLALVSSLATHIKYSDCCIGKCATRGNSTPTTPENIPVRPRGRSDPNYYTIHNAQPINIPS